MDIPIKNISLPTYLYYLNEDNGEEEKGEVDDSEEYSRDCYNILDQFIDQHNHQFKHSDPIIVVINDIVEVYLDDGSPEDFPFA